MLILARVVQTHFYIIVMINLLYQVDRVLVLLISMIMELIKNACALRVFLIHHKTAVLAIFHVSSVKIHQNTHAINALPGQYKNNYLEGIQKYALAKKIIIFMIPIHNCALYVIFLVMDVRGLMNIIVRLVKKERIDILNYSTHHVHVLKDFLKILLQIRVFNAM